MKTKNLTSKYLYLILFFILIVGVALTVFGTSLAKSDNDTQSVSCQSANTTETIDGITLQRITNAFKHNGDDYYTKDDASHVYGWNDTTHPRSKSGNTDYAIIDGSYTRAPVSCLAYQYCQNAFNLSADNITKVETPVDNNTDSDPKQKGKNFVHWQVESQAEIDQSLPEAKRRPAHSDAKLFMIDKSHMPPIQDGSITFPDGSTSGDVTEEPDNPVYLENKDPNTRSKGICTIEWDKAGKVQGIDVGVSLTIQHLKVFAWGKGNAFQKYATEHDDPSCVELPFMIVYNRTMQNQVHKKIEEKISLIDSSDGYDCLDMPSGSISFDSDNFFWDEGKFQMEIDYKIGIYKSGTVPHETVNFPVYTLYQDLDVQQSGDKHPSGEYKESISPKSNSGVLPYFLGFEKETGEGARYINLCTKSSGKYKKYGNDVMCTFRANGHCQSGVSTIFPHPLTRTGFFLLSDPNSGSGEYSARWRGMRCGTGLSLAAYSLFELTKTLHVDTATKEVSKNIKINEDKNDPYVFDLKFPMGKYNETMFDTYQGITIRDYLPNGVNPVTDENGKIDASVYLEQNEVLGDKLLVDGSDYDSVVHKYDASSKKYVVDVAMTSGFVASPTNYNGHNLKLVLKAYPDASYSSGNIVAYPQDESGYDPTYNKQNVWQYVNSSSVIINDLGKQFEIPGNNVNVYTPLYSKHHKFYEYKFDEAGKPYYDKDAPVPDDVVKAALPNPSNFYLKNLETDTAGPNSLQKDASSKPITAVRSTRDGVEGIWLFIEWEKDSKGQMIYQTCKNADITYNGFWTWIPNPEQKTCSLKPEGKPVKIGERFSYDLKGTNIEEGTNQIKFIDTPSKGLTFLPETYTVTKTLMGQSEAKPVDPGDIAFVNNLAQKQNMGDGQTTIEWTIHNVEYGAQINISSDYYVNPFVEKEVQNTVEINGQTKIIVNPVGDKAYDKDQSGKGIISDDSPVHIGEKIPYLIKWAGYHHKDSNVVVIDKLSKGLKIDESTLHIEGCTGTPQYTISDPDPETGVTTLTVKMDNQPAGATGTITYMAEVSDVLAPDVFSKVSVSNEYILKVDEDFEMTIDPLINPVIPYPDKEYNKDSDKINDDRPVIVGNEIAYKLTWSNHHDASANIVLIDNLSDGLEYIKGSCSEAGDPSVEGNVLTWDLKEKAKADLGSITYRVKVNDDAQRVLPNIVENSYSIKVGDDPAVQIKKLYNPVIGKQYNVEDPSDASDRVFKDDSTLRVGDIIAYKLVWADNYNVGGNVKLVDTLSKGLEYINGSCPNGDPTINNNVLTWDLGPKDPSQAGYITYRVRVTKDALSDNVKTAYVKNSYVLSVEPKDMPQYQVGPYSLTNPVVPDPIKRYDTGAFMCVTNDSTCHIGDTIAYSLVWSHTENKEADIKLTDTLSKGLTYVEGSANIAPVSVNVLSDGTTQIVWELKNQPKASCGEITYKAKVNENVDLEKGVDNGYRIKVGDNLEKFVNSLHNDVSNVPTATGDSLAILTIIVLLCSICVIAFWFVFKHRH